MLRGKKRNYHHRWSGLQRADAGFIIVERWKEIVRKVEEKGRERGLSESEGGSHATPDLTAHGISALNSAGGSILVLSSATEEVVKAIGH
jgi:hypothetical protein